jgi:hypothetical protein
MKFNPNETNVGGDTDKCYRDTDECYDSHASYFIDDDYIEEVKEAIDRVHGDIHWEDRLSVFTKMAIVYFDCNGHGSAVAARSAAIWFDGLAKAFDRLNASKRKASTTTNAVKVVRS